MSAFAGFKGFGSSSNPQGQQGGFQVATSQAFNKGQGNVYSKGKPANKQMQPMGMNALGMLGAWSPSKTGKGIGGVAGKVDKYGKSLPPQQGQIGPAYRAGMQPPDQQQYNPTGRDLYMGALVGDYNNMQQASNANRNANLQYGQGMVDRAYQDAAGHEQQMGRQADALDQLGQDISGGMTESGNRFADDIKKRVDSTESEFKDRSAEDASSLAYGMDHQMESQLKSLDNGVGPDGRPMTPEQQMAVRSQMLADYAPQKQATMSKVWSDMNGALASLRTQGTGLISQAGQFSLGMQGQGNQLAASLSQVAAGLRQGASSLAMQRRMEGDQAGAQMLTSNPYSPTSLAAVFGELMQVMDSGAGKQQTGFGSKFIGALS